MPARFRRDDLPAAADAGVHHNHMDGFLREIRVCGIQEVGGGTKILGIDIMGDINDRYMWCNREDNPFHHTDIWIRQPKVGKKGYDRHSGIPKCRYAASEAFRPVWVLKIRPVFNRNGSTTSTSVSVSSWRVAATASIPTGPPL